MRSLEQVDYDEGIEITAALLRIVGKLRARRKQAEKEELADDETYNFIADGLVYCKADLKHVMAMLNGVSDAEYKPNYKTMLRDCNELFNDPDVAAVLPFRGMNRLSGAASGTIEAPES